MDRRVHEHVLVAGQLGMKTDPELDHAADASPVLHQQLAGRRPVDTGDDLHQRALAGAVAPNQPDRVARVDAKGDVPQRPEFLRPLPSSAVQEAECARFQLTGRVVSQVELFREAAGFEHGRHQTRSANCSS